ncbi:MFS general substrate transporter [Sanghuangporus baumii]|uniref:MFS general substrate transporter n=1 Tax=Sanghuangporus baumii TaxID=108892 RepID=A0A9Q5HSD5_SANBA|nr:MFS general substrate transporter [Sanghuangporus baumii]
MQRDPTSQMSQSEAVVLDDRLPDMDTKRLADKDSGTIKSDSAHVSEEVPDGGLEAWLLVVGGFFLSLSTFGYFVSWGTYQAYYETVLLVSNTPSQIAWIGSLQYSLIFLPGLLAGRLFDLGYFKPTLITASAAMTIANFLIAECSKYWHFVLCQGLLLGLAAGCIYIPCIAVVSHWFKHRRPVAFAIISFGGSVGGIIYPIIVRNLLPTVGFKWTVRTIAFINLATFIFAIFTMRSRLPPPDILPNLLDVRTFLTPAYLFYVLSTFVAFLGLYTPLTFISVSAELIGLDPSFSFYLVAIANAASAVGRLSSGVLAVSYGPVNVMVICTALAAVFTYIWPFVTTKASFIAATILYGITSGAFICLFAIPVAHLGATHDVGRRTGLQMTVMAFGALAGPPISGVIKQHHSTFHEVGIFAGTMIAGSIFLMLASKFCAVRSLFTGKF